MELAIKWFSDRLDKVTYSMGYRYGPSSYDCSSAVYYALIQGGLLPGSSSIGNTDSLFRDLELNGWTQVPEVNGVISARRGDVFIWGVRGSSGGALGHTGIFLNENDIIHCAYGYNGIHIDNHDWLHAYNGSPANTVYRYVGAPAPQPPTGSATDQILEVGSIIKFDQIYRVDDLQIFGGIWQIRNHKLCREGFTWHENGIPAEPVYEVDQDGYASSDQSLEIGSLFKIPGKYAVLDLGFVSGMWIAEIEWNGLKFWVDVESATEIAASDPGTSTPNTRPNPPVIAPEPEVPVVSEIPVAPVESTKPIEPAKPLEPEIKPPEINKPKEETKVAFTKKDQEALRIATQDVQVITNNVADSEGVQEIVKTIPRKVKLVVYLIGDGLLGLGAIAPQLVILSTTNDPFMIATTLSSVLATSGLFLLTMFGIYSKGK